MNGQAWVRTIDFTRLSNTTQYTAGDAVSDHATTPTLATFTISGLAQAVGWGGHIESVTLYKSDQDQTGASFGVHFFDTAPAVGGWSDNAQLSITDAEWKTCIGFVQLTASADVESVVTGDLYGKTNLDLPYRCLTSPGVLYVVLSALGTYTPASAEAFTLRIGGRMD